MRQSASEAPAGQEFFCEWEVFSLAARSGGALPYCTFGTLSQDCNCSTRIRCLNEILPPQDGARYEYIPASEDPPDQKGEGARWNPLFLIRM